jgi:hypothetical protein
MLSGVFLPHMRHVLRQALSADEIVEQCVNQFVRGASL